MLNSKLGKYFLSFLLVFILFNLKAQYKEIPDCITAVEQFHEVYNKDHVDLVLKFDEVQNIDKLEKSPYFQSIVFALFQDLFLEKIAIGKTSDVGILLEETYEDLALLSEKPKFLKQREIAYQEFVRLLKR